MSGGVHSNFGDHAKRWAVVRTGSHAIVGQDIPMPEAVAEACEQRMPELGLQPRRGKAVPYKYQQPRAFDLDDGRRIAMQHAAAYAMPLANHEDPLAAGRALAQHIRDENGPGRVWLLSRPSYLLKGHEFRENPTAMPLFGKGYEVSIDEEPYCKSILDPNSHERRVRIGVYYVHEAMLETDGAK